MNKDMIPESPESFKASAPYMHEIAFRAYYEETDAGGVVYHSNYLKFAERGRTEFLRSVGFENPVLRQDHGVRFLVRRAELEYLAPAFLDDLLSVFTAIESVKNTSFVMKQAVFCHNRLLCFMRVVLVCVDESGRPVRLPSNVRTAFLSRCVLS